MKIACPNCGADIVFVPIEQKCYCEHCNNYLEVETLSFDLNSNDYKLTNCVSCGAKLIMTETNILSKCIYCESQNLLIERLRDSFKPEKIIPFKIGKEEVINYYMEFIHRHIHEHFSIDFIKNPELIDIKGIYVPYYIFNWMFEMSILGEKGYNYKTKESVQMDVGVQFDDNVMKFLNPYDANELVDFNPGYLAGFFADTYDENINKITDNSKKIAGKRIYNKQEYQDKIQSFSDYLKYEFQDKKTSWVRIENKDIDFKKHIKSSLELIDKNFVLFPVWFFYQIIDGEKYYFAVNGLTGRLVCKMPVGEKSRLIFDNTSNDIQYDYHARSSKEIKIIFIFVLLAIILISSITLSLSLVMEISFCEAAIFILQLLAGPSFTFLFFLVLLKIGK